MIIIYLILWFIFNERVTLEVALVGLVVCALVDVFARVILGRVRHRRPSTRIRLFASAVKYCFSLLGEIFRCNWQVIRLILSPSMEVEPELHTFSTRLTSDLTRVTLANSITLTPGTITCGLAGDKFVVHALDTTMAQGIECTDFEKRLMEMEDIAHES